MVLVIGLIPFSIVRILPVLFQDCLQARAVPVQRGMIFADFCVLVRVERLPISALVIRRLSLHSFSLWLPAQRGHVSVPLHSRNLWLSLEHLKHRFATRLSPMMQISHPSLTFFCIRSFRVCALTSITRCRVRLFVSYKNLAVMSHVFKLSSGFFAGRVSCMLLIEIVFGML